MWNHTLNVIHWMYVCLMTYTECMNDIHWMTYIECMNDRLCIQCMSFIRSVYVIQCMTLYVTHTRVCVTHVITHVYVIRVTYTCVCIREDQCTKEALRKNHVTSHTMLWTHHSLRLVNVMSIGYLQLCIYHVYMCNHVCHIYSSMCDIQCHTLNDIHWMYGW